MNSILSLRKTSKHILSLVAALFIFFNAANAAVETVMAKQTSPVLSSYSVLKVQDNKYDFMVANPTTWEAGFINKKITNRVIFRIDQRNQKFQPLSYTATIVFNVTSKSWNESTQQFEPSSVIDTLVVDYKVGAGTYTDRAVYEFTGASAMNVQVTSLTVTNGALSQSNLSFEAEIETERYYAFDPQLAPTNLSHRSTDLAATGELEVYWGFIPGAEEYDLEWVYINNYNTATTEIVPESLKIDERIFQFNSTRVTTSNTYYRIPYIYGRGYILYRLRAIGKSDKDNYTNYKTGAWSSVSAPLSTVAAFAKKFPNTGTGETFISHNDSMNWQFSASYAENGKSKAVISYFDGSLRNRQSVTKSKTDNQIIVGESIYDYQGRPAIQVLPVPVQKSKIAFNLNFNQNLSNVPYSKTDFDVDATECLGTPTAPMRSDTLGTANPGASNYYSASNRDKVNQQAYVPDAQQYPFTQVEYTPDNTGRIKAQGGVGKIFQLKDSLRTSYFYSSPEQEELDRLFGSEAGDALHYKKNMVRDANGQLSISMLDPQGRVVATCLAGVKPLALDALNSIRRNWMRTDLLAKVRTTDFSGTKNELDLATRSLTVNKQLIPEVGGKGYFSYAIQGQKYQDLCPLVSTPVCYDCIFDLKINLTDECGNQYLSGANDTTITKGYTFPANCSNAPPSFSIGGTTDTWETNANLDKTKTYQLTKTLTLNQEALDKYTDNYLKGNCILTYQHFKDAELAKMDFSGCNMTCQECADSLGVYSKYDVTQTPSCSPCLTEAQWQKLYDQCFENCNEKSSACEAGYETMLADVSLLGQYGQIMPGGNEVGGKFVNIDPSVLNPEAYPLSVFNEANLLPRKKLIQDAYFATGNPKNIGWAPSWRFPYDPAAAVGKKFTYLSEDGNIALVLLTKNASGSYVPEIISDTYLETLTDGRKAVRPQFLKNFADFVNAWDPAWAGALVHYHPEYEYYNFCVEISASHDFDDIWQQNTHVNDLPSTWQATGWSGSNGRKAFMDPLRSGIDPYFNINTNPNFLSQDSSAMRYAMEHYANGKSIWEVAYMTVHCPNALGTMGCSTCSYPANTSFTDAEWGIFSGLYFSLKQKFQQQRAVMYAIEKGSYNGCIGAETFDAFKNNFYQSLQPNPTNPWTAAPFNFAFFRSQFFNFEQPCNVDRYTLYKEKQIRFPGISDLLDINALHAEVCYPTDAAQGTYEVVDCPAKNQQILDESKNLVDLSLYQQCGQCPNAHNLELFLNALVKKPGGSKLTTSSLPINCDSLASYPEFTDNLVKAFPFSSKTNIIFHGGTLGTNINTERPQLNSSFTSSDQGCDLKFAFTILPTVTTPAPASLNSLGYTFSDITNICCLKSISNPTAFALSANKNFQLTATVKVKAGDPLYDTSSVTHPERVHYRELIIEGITSCFDVGGCTFAPVCRASKDALKLQTLLNAMAYTSPAYNGDPAITSSFTTTTAVNLNSIPHVKAAYLALEPSLNRAVYQSDANSELNWHWKMTASGTNTHIELDVPSLDHTLCGLDLGFPNTTYGPGDVVSFSNIRPDVSLTAGSYYITALVKKTGELTKYIDLTIKMPCLNLGECSSRLPSGMISGNTKNTAEGLGIVSCNPSAAALAMQAELNSVYITNHSRSFTCTGSKLTFTLDAAGCGSGYTGELRFPAGSEFGHCSPLPGYYSYQDIVAFSGISPDMDYAISGLANHNFVIYAVMSNGLKVQLKGSMACIHVGDCFPVYGDCNWTENKIQNGHFEQGNTLFSSQYTYVSAPPLSSSYNEYCIVKNAQTANSSWSGKDHTSGFGNFIVAKADAQGKNIWQQYDIAVQKNTTYRFSAWISRPNQFFGFAPNATAQVLLSVDGNVSSPAVSAVFTPPGNWNEWKQIEFTWFSGNDTIVSLSIKDQYNSTAQEYLYGLDDIAFQACQTSTLCEITTIPIPEVEVDPDPCHTQLVQIATINAKEKYESYVAGMRKQFQENYIKKCLDVYEEFHMKYEDSQHHFTLYYYDQAGNLVRTIPPAGVNLLADPSDLEDVRLDRFNHTRTVFTNHTLATTYKYNSLNQLVAQVSPDVEKRSVSDDFSSYFWYDKLGRLVVSQNAKQYKKNSDHLIYSYTVYDSLGRITEVGEIHAAAGDIEAGTGPIENQYADGVLNENSFALWLANGTKTEVTKTVYDLSAAPSGSNFKQDHLRKRVSAMYVDNSNNNLGDGYDYATYYSYDVHGNVKSLLQDNPPLGSFNANQRYKRIDYEYDLISGNVKQVSYQASKADAFYHKYLYDADNRITHVFTSKDKVIWDEDVKYFYYKHGPLARTELGNEKVQGTDYAYTLQGWIKGINSTNLNAANDIAKDGEITQVTNVNKNIARDVASYSLSYYLGNGTTTMDYKPISTSSTGFIASTTAAAYIQSNAPDLYNGNISSMMTTILDSTGAPQPQLTAYKYDQLNRIKEMNAYRNGTLSGNDWAGASNDSSYHSKMDYDANGNITYMLTNGNVATGGKRMDELHYNYIANSNKLSSVNDAVISTAYGDDIDNQPTNNYQYDAIGNLKSDVTEEIETIDWSVYGKIKSITRTSSSTKPNLEFTYDASGNRTSKKVIPKTGDAITTYYVRDASGNVMSTYTKKQENSIIDLYLQEQHIYGSSRTGLQKRNLNLTHPVAATANMYAREIDQKEYELSNHLGNVLATVSDKRTPHHGAGTTIDYYQAVVNSTRDYYAFGAQMQGRGINGSYRYGFNGKENDKETVGTGQGTQDYGMRIYNPSLGKFLSVDPITKSYPMLTPYQFASDCPISGIDRDGLEYDWFMYAINAYQNITQSWDENIDMARSGLNDVKEGSSKKNSAYDNAKIPKSTQKILNSIQITQGVVKTYYGASGIGHTVLDAVGLVPLVGDGADVLNSYWYAVEGRQGMATVSAIAIIPLYGDLATGGKWAVKGANYTADITDWGIGTLEVIFKDAKNFDIGLWATKKASEDGKVLTLSEISIYSQKEVGKELKNKLTPRVVLEYRRAVEEWAKEQGFEKIIFQGERSATENSTSARPGKAIEVSVDLNK